jgi:hypothetical protein
MLLLDQILEAHISCYILNLEKEQTATALQLYVTYWSISAFIFGHTSAHLYLTEPLIVNLAQTEDRR